MYTGIEELPLGKLIQPKQGPSRLGKRRSKKLRTRTLRERGPNKDQDSKNTKK